MEIQCQSFADAGGRVVALVLGHDRERYLEALSFAHRESSEALPCGGCSLFLLHNPSPEFGPFSSLKQACGWIERATNYPAAFFLPIDTPLPSATVLRELAAALQSGIKVVEPRFKDRGGHPVLLSHGFLLDLLAVDVRSVDARLDVQIRQQREIGNVVSLPVDDRRVTLNLNDPEAWERYFAELDASPLTTSSTG